MAQKETFRLSVYAVITDEKNHVLMLKKSEDGKSWAFPGGAVDANETVHMALARECKEEMALDVSVEYLSGIYCREQHQGHAVMFRCRLKNGIKGIKLSSEHVDYAYKPIEDLKPSQQKRVQDCLQYNGRVVSSVL